MWKGCCASGRPAVGQSVHLQISCQTWCFSEKKKKKKGEFQNQKPLDKSPRGFFHACLEPGDRWGAWIPGCVHTPPPRGSPLDPVGEGNLDCMWGESTEANGGKKGGGDFWGDCFLGV